MNTEEVSRFNLSAKEIRSYPWQELLRTDPIRQCYSFHQIFATEAEKCRLEGDATGGRVYQFLHVIASFHPTFDSPSNPFRASVIDSDGSRTLDPNDLAKRDLNVLEVIVHEIEDPEFKARVADVLWTMCNNYKYAQLAALAYLSSANRLKTEDLWPPYVKRLERAAQLSNKRGFETQFAAVLQAVESDIVEFEANPTAGLLCCRLMEILLVLEQGDSARYSALSERLAKGFSESGEWHYADCYWRIATDWHRTGNDHESANRTEILAADTHILRAEACLKQTPPQSGAAAHWFGLGLEGLRRAKAGPERIKEVHLKFRAAQITSMGELDHFGITEEQIPGLKQSRESEQAASRKFVSGFEFHDALLRFAYIKNPTDLERLKKQEIESGKEAIWDKLFSTTILDRSGKVADVIPAVGFEELHGDEEVLRKKLVQTAGHIQWPIAVQWILEPARIQILEEHPVTLRDLRFLVSHNPFITSGHEIFFLKGIQAGFHGDWIVAMHLLVLQFEASLRHVLQQHGQVTSIKDAQGIQKEKDINQLLWDEKIEDIFGADAVFDMRGILIDKCGRNMRNELAHGLMPHHAFNQVESVYLWWLAIRFCYIGVRSQKNP